MWALTKPLQDLKDQNDFKSSLQGGKRVPPVEDLLEALVAGHLHAQLHHLVDLLRLVSILAPDHHTQSPFSPSSSHLAIMESSPHSSIIWAAQDPMDSSVMVSATLERIKDNKEHIAVQWSTWVEGSSHQLQKSPHWSLHRRWSIPSCREHTGRLVAFYSCFRFFQRFKPTLHLLLKVSLNVLDGRTVVTLTLTLALADLLVDSDYVASFDTCLRAMSILPSWILVWLRIWVHNNT